MRVQLFGVWCAAWLVAGVGFRAEAGVWPEAGDWLLATPLLSVLALPIALGQLIGLPFLEPGGLDKLQWLAFWSVLGGLHVAALLTGRRRFVALAAAVLLPASWHWTLMAVGLMGI
jgi:hypothetical protein